MELYQLRTFVKVADEGNLTRAAELLFTSQPAISAQIKALEDELGISLFERTSKGMKLTAKGQLLYTQAMGTLEAADSLKQQAESLKGELVGELKIGVHTDFDFMRIGELHSLMGREHERIGLHFIASMTSLILPDLRKGKLDGGFFFGPCPYADLAVTELCEVDMSVVGPADWSDRLEGADLPALVEQPWVYTSETCPFWKLMQDLFEPVGNDPKKVAFVDSEDAVRELVRAGAGLSLLRKTDALKLRTAGDVAYWQGEVPSIKLNFAVQKNRVGEPLIRALTDQIVSMWATCQAGGANVKRMPNPKAG
ncbi:MAG: LysR family transcriptional regulator [Gammaproteobacteria bacterium]